MFKNVLIFLVCTLSTIHAKTVYDITEYGARSGGATLCTEAIQATIDDCHEAGGGKVIIPAGEWLSLPLTLRSHVHIELMPGAVLKASQEIDDYPSVFGRWEGIEKEVYASLFTGHDLTNVSLTGRGTVDGQGEVWWEAHEINKAMRKKAGITEREPLNPPGSPLKWPRPRLVNLYNCTNVLIRDLTFIDSPAWTIHPVYCQDVTVDNIRIIQPYESPNTDGINPESCQNVRISNCFVDCGDDCITIKSGYNEDGRRVNIPCENIVITNCTFAHGRSAVGIGSETSGGVRNVVVSNCVFKNTYRGLRIKSARGRGNVVENIRATNIVMENVGTGISLDMFYGGNDESPRPVTVGTPHFRNIRYSHITGTNIRLAGEVLGLPEAPMENIVFEDVYLEAQEGLNVLFAKDFTLRDVDISVPTGAAFKFRKCEDVELDNVSSPNPAPDDPVILMQAVTGARVHDCAAAQGTSLFLQLEGNENSDIKWSDNDMEKAVVPVLGEGLSGEGVTE
ncbi:glycoside hydrolase family 28 protein [candidate division KSB1 bacterium]|nr:glycoside hydrolase family 28 protein [candidate division KSB1 bacterium]